MDTNWIRKLAAITALAPSADNSQPWKLYWDGIKLAITFAVHSDVPRIFSAGSHASLLSAGAAIEHLQVALDANTVAANWQWPSNPILGQPYASVALTGSRENFVAPEGALRRHTNRFPFRRDRVPSGITDKLEKFGEN